MLETLTYLPTRQRTAREQLERGVSLPYWVHDLDKPNNFHLTLAILQPDDLDRLVLYCRKYAAKLKPNPNDNREALDYPVTNRERVSFLRHVCLNRTTKGLDKVCGYSASYESLLFRIAKRGVDVAAKQLEFKRNVALLISASYPALAEEAHYWFWQCENKLCRGDQPPTNLFDLHQGGTP